MEIGQTKVEDGSEISLQEPAEDGALSVDWVRGEQLRGELIASEQIQAEQAQAPLFQQVGEVPSAQPEEEDSADEIDGVSKREAEPFQIQCLQEILCRYQSRLHGQAVCQQPALPRLLQLEAAVQAQKDQADVSRSRIPLAWRLAVDRSTPFPPGGAPSAATFLILCHEKTCLTTLTVHVSYMCLIPVSLVSFILEIAGASFIFVGRNARAGLTFVGAGEG